MLCVSWNLNLSEPLHIVFLEKSPFHRWRACEKEVGSNWSKATEVIKTAQEVESLTDWLWKLLSSWLAWGALISVCCSGATGTSTTVFQILICAVERMCSVYTVVVCLSDCTDSYLIPFFTWKCLLLTVKTDSWALWLKLTLNLPEWPFPWLLAFSALQTDSLFTPALFLSSFQIVFALFETGSIISFSIILPQPSTSGITGIHCHP